MLDIILEFRKGILFVRLNGELTKKTTLTLKQEVINVIYNNGINHIVFNIENISKLDMKGISSLFYTYEICKNHNGICYICGINEKLKSKIKNSRLLNYVYELDDELSILQKI